MKIIISTLICLFVAGCSTVVPVTAKFPEAPTKLMEKCPQLNKLDDDAKLSDVARTVTNNYTEYYSCAVKNDGWIEWYQIQKKIFEQVK